MALPSPTLTLLANLQPADFEQLANRILRAHSPYESLIPGLNEQGRTVPAPVDAVCWIPGTSPPKGVLFAHTSISRKKLREKWLFDPTLVSGGKARREGDVVKALRRAEEIRLEVPKAALILVLACTVDPSEALATEVKGRCARAGLEVEFWAASRLADFLDDDPHGQFLRQELWGIPPVVISSELLQKLSAQSCASYAAFTFEDITVPRTERELDRLLRDEIRRAGQSLRFLVAESGFGKSSAALALLREHLAAGGSGLWLIPEDIAVGGSIEGAVEVALRRLQPALLPGCGAKALDAASGSRGLLLVVDDLRRSGEAVSLLHRLSSWVPGRQGSEVEHARCSTRPWFLLCPLWPRLLSQLSDQVREHAQSLCIHAGAYTAEEGTNVLQARARLHGETLSKIQARRLSDALGHDPLLLSLVDLRRRESREERGSRPASLEVLGRFLEKRCVQLAGQEDADFAASDYEDALLELARWMLMEREMAPTWRRIRSWLHSSPDELRALRRIIADRQIAHLLTESGEEVFHYRHDRVRDAVLAAALTRHMKMDTLADELLDEPFYAELFGQALLAPGIDPVWVDRLRERNPLALFRALQLFETPRDPLQEAVTTALKTWLAQEVVTGRALDALQWEAVRFLAETDSPLVQELSRSFPETWHGVFEARFRNGDVSAGIDYCAGMELGPPYVGFVPLVEHVQVRFGASLTGSLADWLTQRPTFTQQQLRGALFLVGHLAEPALADAVRSSWERAAEHRLSLLSEFLWAALRCLPESEDEAAQRRPVCSILSVMYGGRYPVRIRILRARQRTSK